MAAPLYLQQSDLASAAAKQVSMWRRLRSAVTQRRGFPVAPIGWLLRWQALVEGQCGDYAQYWALESGDLGSSLMSSPPDEVIN